MASDVKPEAPPPPPWLKKLTASRDHSAGWAASCPVRAHGGFELIVGWNPELHRYTVECLEGCSEFDILQALGLSPRELYYSTNGDRPFLLSYAALQAHHAADGDVEWAWDQLVAKGYLTLVSGRPKAGKSTLLFGLCAALRSGQPFLGMATKPTKVAYCCEERFRTYVKKVEVYGAPDFSYLYYDHQMRLDELVAELEKACALHGIGVVIIDTWPKWAALPQGINDDKGTREAMGLMEGLAQDLAVVAVGYERKGDGNEFGQGVLGHTEITGRADIIIEIKRKATGRVLHVMGRSDAPEEVAFAMKEDGTLNVVDLEEALRDQVYEEIARWALNPALSPPSKNEIFEAVGGRRAAVLAAVDALEAEGRIRRGGQGNRSGWVPSL